MEKFNHLFNPTFTSNDETIYRQVHLNTVITLTLKILALALLA